MKTNTPHKQQHQQQQQEWQEQWGKTKKKTTEKPEVAFQLGWLAEVQCTSSWTWNLRRVRALCLLTEQFIIRKRKTTRLGRERTGGRYWMRAKAELGDWKTGRQTDRQTRRTDRNPLPVASSIWQKVKWILAAKVAVPHTLEYIQCASLSIPRSTTAVYLSTFLSLSFFLSFCL